jgi:16S rRNA processing protein RimM
MSPRRRNNDRRSSGQGPRSAQAPRRAPQASRPAVNSRIPKTIEPSTPSRVGVASVRRSWGTDGSIAVSQFSDGEIRFSPGDVVYIDGGRPATVVESHKAGTATVLQLDVIRNTRAADALRGTIIEVEGDDLPEAPEGAFYHHEIVGTKVRTTDGEELGVVLEIIVTGANDVYVVGEPGATESKDQILIPAIADVVLEVDVNNGVVTVNLPEGLR